MPTGNEHSLFNWVDKIGLGSVIALFLVIQVVGSLRAFRKSLEGASDKWLDSNEKLTNRILDMQEKQSQREAEYHDKNGRELVAQSVYLEMIAANLGIASTEIQDRANQARGRRATDRPPAANAENIKEHRAEVLYGIPAADETGPPK